MTACSRTIRAFGFSGRHRSVRRNDDIRGFPAISRHYPMPRKRYISLPSKSLRQNLGILSRIWGVGRPGCESGTTHSRPNLAGAQAGDGPQAERPRAHIQGSTGKPGHWPRTTASRIESTSNTKLAAERHGTQQRTVQQAKPRRRRTFARKWLKDYPQGMPGVRRFLGLFDDAFEFAHPALDSPKSSMAEKFRKKRKFFLNS